MVEDADRCPHCGTHSYDQDEWVPATQTCRSCQRLALFRSEFHDSPVPHKPGQSVVLKRKGNDDD